MKKFQILEEKISKVIDKINTLTKDNKALNTKVSKLKAEVAQKGVELKEIKKGSGSSSKLKSEIEKLNKERDTVRLQVEKLLRELESVEL